MLPEIVLLPIVKAPLFMKILPPPMPARRCCPRIDPPVMPTEPLVL